MAEEARLESVYTPKAYPEFESRSLRKKKVENQRIIIWFSAFFVYNNREIILKMGLLLLNCDHLRLFLPKMFQQLKHSAETFLGQAEFSVHLLIAVLGVV